MMIESGSFPSRTDAFPAGLRVLVVDDDLTWLKILEKMLKKCSYQVTTCSLAREALSMLRERRDGFDIVISDVNMPDMNGFKLLEHVGLEMDLPVIMMSVDWETSKVMEGVQHGACDYLLKPVKMKELRNIWQHVVRKKIHELRDIKSLEHRGADIQMLINGLDNLEDKYLLQAGDLGAIKRRKDSENKRHVDDLGVVDCLTSKKARVVWSVDLHRKFVDAVNQIGFDKVGPKKVLKLMNVPGLTRENVASHLQKYRLYLSRMQKEETQKQHQDFSSGDSATSFGLQNTSAVDQNNVQYTMPVNNTMGPNVLEADHLEGIVSFLAVTEPETALSAEFTDLHQDASISYQMGPNHPFKLAPDQEMDMEIKYQSLESTLPSEQWMNQLWEPGQQALHEPLADPQHHFQANTKVSFPERDKYSKNDAMGSALSSIPLPAMNPETLEAVACMTKWEPFVQEPVLSEPNLHYAKKNMVQEYNDTKSIALAPQNVEFLDYCYYNPEFFAELQSQCYDELVFHSDKYCEYPIENPVMEQGLFMV